MRIEYQDKHYSNVVCDLLCYPIFVGEADRPAGLKTLDKATRGVLLSALASGEFKPEPNRTCMIHRPSGMRAKRLLLIGAGSRGDFDLAVLREVAGTGVRQGRLARCRKVAVCLRGKLPVPDAARVTTEGAIGGNYEMLEHKTRDRERRGVENLFIVHEKRAKRSEVEAGIHQGTIIGRATDFTRNLVNEPANILTPSEFAERALRVGADSGLEVQILEREDMELLGMNSLLAVSRGSHEPPKLIVLRIQGQSRATSGSKPLLAFVGKGVTFDSGGISIKPPDRMEDMKADMAGGAAVLGAMAALAQLRPRQRVIGLIPAVENLPSGRAVKPGDVVKSYLGKTIEIINTDAEGRLILADALAYARTLGATRIVDVATLTGACIVALGSINAGMMGTDDKTIERMRKNHTITGEKLWQLPVDKAYRKALDSEVADMKNVGPRAGGAITAAKFLQEFVEDTPWVHLDIAGVDLDHEGKPFAAKGATGFGVRSLVQLLL